jgi:hypothetical protein
MHIGTYAALCLRGFLLHDRVTDAKICAASEQCQLVAGLRRAGKQITA